MEIANLPVKRIKPDPSQPRQTLDEEKIQEMAQSMKTEGVINPIEVDKDLIIVTGEMRWRAAQAAGLKEIPAKIISISPKERFRRQVVENIHHNTMTDWDTGKALHKLLEGVQDTELRSHSGGHPDQGISKLARILGKSKRYILDHLELQNAPEELRSHIQKGLVPYTFIRALKNTPEEFKKEMEQQIIKGHFTNRDIAVEVSSALRRNPEKAKEIFKAKDVVQLYKISPRSSDKIRESYTPVNQLSEIVDNLVEWLRNNPPESVGFIHAPRIILNLAGAVEQVNEWGHKAKQLKLKGK